MKEQFCRNKKWMAILAFALYTINWPLLCLEGVICQSFSASTEHHIQCLTRESLTPLLHSSYARCESPLLPIVSNLLVKNLKWSTHQYVLHHQQKSSHMHSKTKHTLLHVHVHVQEIQLIILLITIGLDGANTWYTDVCLPIVSTLNIL